ncbi:hypothetical protein B7463_g3079, partial [Scytalidium lignicola]
MSNEVAQPTEQDLTRSNSSEAVKGARPPALDTSSITSHTQIPKPLSQDQTTAQNTASTEESDRTILPGSQPERELDSEEAPEVPQKDRTFLRVPSRSSSNKIQPSPTSTGLSGATVGDPRASFGGRSKESKGSVLGRRRNGSTSSSKMSITPQGQSAGNPGNQNPQTSTHATSRAAKKSFLSFLNCCSVPDHANTPDSDEGKIEANKVTKLPISGRPATASTPEPLRLDHQAGNAGQFTSEKVPLPTDSTQDRKAAAIKPQLGKGGQTGTNGAATHQSADINDQPLPELPKEAEPASVGPSSVEPNQPVVVQEPAPKDSLDRTQKSVDNEASEGRSEGDDDTQMEDSEPESSEKQDIALPAPPNVIPHLPQPPSEHPEPPAASDELIPAESSEPKQQFLLPPIAPRFQGKKCLVLDLDETLVHSSFKYGDPLLDQLDIHHVVHHRLFRESCYNHQGNYVKDLSQVGRDLKETIIIDNSPTSYIFHPQHAVPISSWFSDAHDNELLDLIPVLEDLAGSQVRDSSPRPSSPVNSPAVGSGIGRPSSPTPPGGPKTAIRRRAAADQKDKLANARPSSTRAAGAGGSSSTMLRLYTDESPGLKVDPVVVLVLSLVFIFSVVALHNSLARKCTEGSGLGEERRGEKEEMDKGMGDGGERHRATGLDKRVLSCNIRPTKTYGAKDTGCANVLLLIGICLQNLLQQPTLCEAYFAPWHGRRMPTGTIQQDSVASNADVPAEAKLKLRYLTTAHDY